jgi:anti-sigma-K factor RskA
MDRQKILDDGLLTSYLLGTLSDEQHSEVSRILEEDSELQEQFQLLEADFERMAMENAIAPPAAALSGLKKQMEAEKERPVITLSPPNKNFTVLRSRLLVAASLAALFALGAFWFYSRWQNTLEELEALQIQTASLQNQMNSLEGNLTSTTQQFQKLTNPDVIPMVLEGNELLPDSRAVAYMNPVSREVVVNPNGLPALGPDQTYQMWADVEGVMINMGLVPTDVAWVELTYIDNAESLNITIEPAGGNDHPTVENLISSVLL